MSRALLACLLTLLALVSAPSPAAAQEYDEQNPQTEVVEEAPPAPEEDEWVEESAEEEWWTAPEPELEPEWPAPEPDPAWPAPEPEPEPEWPEPEPEPLIPTIPVPTTRTIPGKIAYVRADGKAAIPRQAPKRVKRVIAAANEIVGKPYKWGGGHARLVDKGYDCSGTVGYALIRAGLLPTTMTSGQFAKWGSKHAGRHITIYANKGHVYMEVAGLRLDTSPVGDPTGRKGPRWRQTVGRRAGFATRHPQGL